MISEAKLPAGFPAPGPVGEVIIKDYPGYRLAKVTAGSGGVSADQNAMFRPLFNHIKRNDIAMTAPVEMGYPAEISTRPEEAAAAKPVSMAFLYGQSSLGRAGADADDPRVVVEDAPGLTVLSVGIRGHYQESRLAEALRRLNQWMVDHPGRVQVIGEPRYLGYNSPMVPGFLRYGEVQLPIRRLAGPDQQARTGP